MKLPVYLDHHATTPCDPRVTEAMLPYFTEQFGNAHARSHANGRTAARVLEHAKAEIAALMHAQPERITLTSGATEANHLAFHHLPADREEICIGALEHPSVVEAAQATGCKLHIIPATPEGFITPEALHTVLSERTALVSIQAANHEIGTIQPIAALAEAAHAAGVLFHTDATQAAGKIPLDVAGIDRMGFSAHKLYGPQGIGALFCRDVLPQRNGTTPLPLAVGFGMACTLAAQNMAAEQQHLQHLAALFLEGLPPHHLNGAEHPRLAGSLNLRFAGYNAEDILLDCAEELCLSTGAACASASREPSAVLRAIGLTDAEIASSIRIGFGRFNTGAEARFAAEILSARMQPAHRRQAR